MSDHAQLGFFSPHVAPPRSVLADDAFGTIYYDAAIFSRAESDDLFDSLHGEIDWRADRRMMYDREVDVPRLVASCAVTELTPSLQLICERVERHVGVVFERIGLNLYRDGNDSVAPHNDDIASYGETPTIALVSLGALRRMQLRTKPHVEGRRSFALDLDPGSVLVMAGTSQANWLHGVAKTKHPVGPRISVALRRKSE